MNKQSVATLFKSAFGFSSCFLLELTIFIFKKHPFFEKRTFWPG